ncbi:hypothetical protein GOP47_0018623 [Adiantum capillus-veneris]|uniref:Uncharacterized protein n=1 Tax=Adiantum capillus-veneris TaxID=13818 RepID=A0A9D4UEU7_ADICA|nr:hypothetical protein GOP47_0018623 [Adiantum capillus-veneris]
MSALLVTQGGTCVASWKLLSNHRRGFVPSYVKLEMVAISHVNPLLELSLKLAAEGVTISFINIPHYHSRILPSLQPLLDRFHLPLRLLSLSDAYPSPPDLRIRGSMERCLQYISSCMLEEVENVMHSLLKQEPLLPFTCLLADVRIPFSQCLADKFGIPRIAFWTQSAASFSYHVTLAGGFHLPADEREIIEHIPGVPTHTASEAPVIFRRELVGDFIFDFILKPFLQLNGALAVVFYINITFINRIKRGKQNQSRALLSEMARRSRACISALHLVWNFGLPRRSHI